MRISIDCRGVNWYKGTGIGTYTYNVLKHLPQIDINNYFHLYWSGNNYEEFIRENSNIIMASKKHHNFFEQYYFPSNLKNNKIDLFHVPQNGIGLNENISCKKVVTIHDLIPYVMPETVGKGYLIKFLEEMPRIIRICDAIITVSEWSKKDILRFFPNAENKVYVTPLAADLKYKPLNKEKCKCFLQKTYNIDKPFVLYIGGFSPRKNVKSLISAFSNIYKLLNKEHKLVIVGAYKDEISSLNILSNDLDLSSKIIFTGYVPDAHLPILYNACEVFVYPSFYEGFGLPPLEAMSCGTPVITSNISSIPEVTSDSSILINPFDIHEIETTLINLLNNESLKETLSIKGLIHSKDFSWKKTAEQTLKVYEQVYKQNKD